MQLFGGKTRTAAGSGRPCGPWSAPECQSRSSTAIVRLVVLALSTIRLLDDVVDVGGMFPLSKRQPFQEPLGSLRAFTLSGTPHLRMDSGFWTRLISLAS